MKNTVIHTLIVQRQKTKSKVLRRAEPQNLLSVRSLGRKKQPKRGFAAVKIRRFALQRTRASLCFFDKHM